MARVVVTVDACHLSQASRYRGIGTYLREVLGGLAAAEDIEVRALTEDPSLVPAGVSVIPMRRRWPDRFRTREHDLLLPFDLRRAGGDVVWCPSQDPPLRCRAPFVVTLHDATPLVWPHEETAAAARRLRRLLPRYRAAASFIAVSGYTAASSAEVMGLPHDRIEVIPHGVPTRFRPGPGHPGAPRTGGDGPPYVLYVGEYGAHKGFAEAFEVAAGLADRGLPHRVRMVGRVAPWWRPRVDALLAASSRPDRVDVAGYVDDLVATYQGAAALILTSRHEGFGLPLVEAMACATPVVAFANSSLPEVVGAGGAVVPDGDVDAVVAALVPLLTNAAAWQEASGRAVERARAFDWASSAAAHVEVLRAAASG